MADSAPILSQKGSGWHQLAEDLLRGCVVDPLAPRPEEVRRLASQFAVRQAELEAQLRQLQETQRQLEAYRDRYVDLYDSAPLGYATLDEDGYVQEINLAGASLVGEKRDALTGHPLGEYVAKEDQEAFLHHVRRCAAERCEVTSEIGMVAKDGASIVVQLHSIPIEGPAEDTLCKTAITDITQRRRREERTTSLARLKEQLLGPSALADKLRLITDGVVQVFGADFARIWVLDEGDLCERGCRHAAVAEGPDVCRNRSHCLHLVASSGRYTALDGSHRRVPLGCYKIGRVASGEETKFVTNEVTRDPRVHDHGWAESLGLVSFAGYRLLSPEGTPLGVLALFSKRKIDADEDALLEDLANTAAQVIRTGRVEELLRREKALVDIAVDSISGLFYVLDNQGRFVRWNHYLEEVTGLAADELRGSDALNTIAPDDRQLVAGKIQEVFANGQAEVEARLLGKDGVREVWFTGRRMDVGPASYLVGSGIDITDRKRAEEALQQERNLLRTLIDNLPDYIYIKDAKSRFLVANPAVARAMGAASPTDLLGKSDLDFYPEQQALEYRRDEQRVLCSGQPLVNKEEPHVDSSATPRAVLTTKVPIRDSQGRVVGLVGISRDITERKRTEEALKEADRRKNEFLATLAHELRNPLAPIRSTLQLIKLRAKDPAAVEEARSVAERQLHQLVRLVDDLLDVSRITRGKIALRKEWVELARIVQSAIETASPQIDAGNHRLSLSLLPEPVYLEADPTRLAQAVSNLLINAAKYTEPGGNIRLSVARDRNEVLIAVEDNGVGIAAEMLPTIFDMFSQADRSLQRVQGGLGIGLTLVKRLVEMHGGAVRASSAGQNRGSTFTIRLPVAPETQQKRPEGQPPPDDGADRPTVKCRVLVVDDNVDAAQTLAAILSLYGHEAHTAHDGAHAVEAALRCRPDIVLLDIGMPGMNGYEVARRLRQQHELAHVRLIALTGFGQNEDRQKALNAGFHHHLTKPVDIEQLQAVMASLVQQDSQQGLCRPPGTP